MKRTKRWLVVGITVVALAAVSVGVVSAKGGGWFGGKGKGDTYLADELGITEDELAAARGAASERALEDAVANGEISGEQVEMMQARKALMDYIDREAMSADILGITVDELVEKSLNEWLTELDIDRADYMDQMQAAQEAAIAEAVADGVLTQEQANAMSAMRGSDMGGRSKGAPGGQMPGACEGDDCPEGRPEFDGERPEGAPEGGHLEDGSQRDSNSPRGPVTPGNDA